MLACLPAFLRVCVRARVWMSLRFVRIPQTRRQSEPVQMARLNLSAPRRRGGRRPNKRALKRDELCFVACVLLSVLWCFFFFVPNSLFSRRPGGLLTLGRVVKARGSAVQTHFLSLNWSLGVTAAAERHLDGRKEGGEKGVIFYFLFFCYFVRTTPAPNQRSAALLLVVFFLFFFF